MRLCLTTRNGTGYRLASKRVGRAADTPLHETTRGGVCCIALLGTTRVHGLSSYDAAYLELAIRRGLPLACLDGKLKKAAFAVGESVFNP